MKIMKETERKTEKYDVAVIGGGLAGICCAIASARNGANTVLIQDRPVLGGNAGSEVRMHICGASCQGKFANVRETGIIEEILLENKARNPEFSYAEFDTLLWEKTRFQKNLTLYLSTALVAVKTEKNSIKSITAKRLTEERELEIEAKIFADCTGDGTPGYLAGAEYMFGREDRAEFGEPNAKARRDDCTMGNSLMFHAADVGHKVNFTRPDWAYDFKDGEWTKKVQWIEINSGYWWIEVGGRELHCLHESEKTREECLKIIYGVWDYIKNRLGDGRADSLVIDWVGSVPAKREGRRFVGDYVLNENDIINHTVFPDTIGYGGWHLDDHPVERFWYFTGLRKYDKEDKTLWHNGIYTVPYRCIYSKNIDNLFLGGRLISVTHRALASTRVMATCAVLGQAAGVAAAMAAKSGCLPRDVDVKKLQKQLFREDCYLPCTEAETDDFARRSRVESSSCVSGFAAENVINGKLRPIDGDENAWRAKNDGKQWLKLKFERRKIGEMRLIFDSDLNAEITQTLSDWVKAKQPAGIPETLVKDYSVDFMSEGKLVKSLHVRDNFQRLNVLCPDVVCDSLKIVFESTNGDAFVKVFEVELYEK